MPNIRSFFGALAVATTLGASAAGAQLPTTRVSFNAGALPAAMPLEMNSFGWFFTPSSTFVLTGIQTQFADLGADGAARNVTIDVYGADPVDPMLGALLGASSFNSSIATGQWGGASFAGQGIALTAGTRYFVGFRNVGMLDPIGYTGGLGASFTEVATTTAGGSIGDLLVEDAAGGTGPYTYEIPFADAGIFAQPLLQIDGVDVPPPVTSTPEPATFVLMAAGVIGIVVAHRRRLAALR